MALNNEDKKDVSRSMGKALANKVSKVTRDGSGRTQEIANQIKARATKSSGQVSKVTKDGRDGGRQHASKVGKAVAKNGSYEMPEDRKQHLYKTWLKADPNNPQASDWKSRIK